MRLAHRPIFDPMDKQVSGYQRRDGKWVEPYRRRAVSTAEKIRAQAKPEDALVVAGAGIAAVPAWMLGAGPLLIFALLLGGAGLGAYLRGQRLKHWGRVAGATAMAAVAEGSRTAAAVSGGIARKAWARHRARADERGRDLVKRDPASLSWWQLMRAERYCERMDREIDDALAVYPEISEDLPKKTRRDLEKMAQQLEEQRQLCAIRISQYRAVRDLQTRGLGRRVRARLFGRSVAAGIQTEQLAEGQGSSSASGSHPLGGALTGWFDGFWSFITNVIRS